MFPDPIHLEGVVGQTEAQGAAARGFATEESRCCVVGMLLCDFQYQSFLHAADLTYHLILPQKIELDYPFFLQKFSYSLAQANSVDVQMDSSAEILCDVCIPDQNLPNQLLHLEHKVFQDCLLLFASHLVPAAEKAASQLSILSK